VVTEHVFTFAEDRSPIQFECETCGAPARMITINEASAVSGFSVKAFRKDVEANGLHFTARADGALFICLAHREINRKLASEKDDAQV